MECFLLLFGISKIRINFWDCGGEVQGLKDGYYRGSQGAIIFRKTGSEDHLEFETLLKPDVKKFYIDPDAKSNLNRNDIELISMRASEGVKSLVKRLME